MEQHGLLGIAHTFLLIEGDGFANTFINGIQKAKINDRPFFELFASRQSDRDVVGMELHKSDGR